tara:strand:- start:279 stop:1556 length:1278 start_codon:yes stop_codon:yes gene_type:complete
VSEEISSSERKKFSRDVVWNLFAFGVMGVSGILLNLLIGRFAGADALGVFNQVFALYILASQAAVFGLHYSTLRHVSEHAESPQEWGRIVTSALALVVVVASAVTLVSLLLAPLFGRVFESPGLSVGWKLALPGLWCFALNKVLLSVLNGLRHMRAFAIAQAGRYVIMLSVLGVLLHRKAPGEELAVVLSVAEVALTVLLSLYLLRIWRPAGVSGLRAWMREHVDFGFKSFLSGTMVELNTRVDVLTLGLFLDDKAVGLYSMAAMLAEGFSQLSVVLRNNVNPLIARDVAEGAYERLQGRVKRISRGFALASFVIGGVAVALYPVFLQILGDPAFDPSFPVFAILIGGIVLASGYLPFNMLLLQAGRPGLHTGFMGLVVLTNIVANFALIPAYGILGAAAATGASYVLSVVYLRLLARKSLGIAL